MTAARMLINTETGATFIHTEKLAAKPQMREIPNAESNPETDTVISKSPAPSAIPEPLLNSSNKKELLAIARRNNLNVTDRFTRAQLISQIREMQNAVK